MFYERTCMKVQLKIYCKQNTRALKCTDVRIRVKHPFCLIGFNTTTITTTTTTDDDDDDDDNDDDMSW